MREIVVVGDAMLDRDVVGTVGRVCPDAPVPVVEVGEETSRPGGAALAAAVMAGTAAGVHVVLVTALGDDETGDEVRELLEGRDVEVVDLHLAGPTAHKERVRAGGQSLLRLDRGSATSPIGPLGERAGDALSGASAVLVADYGRGMTAHQEVRRALSHCVRAVPVVWDPHPRGLQPVPHVRLVTPNAAEAVIMAGDGGERDRLGDVAARARSLVSRWQCDAVAVTLGALGVVLARSSGPCMAVPAPVVTGGDSCGAGDCFAVAATRSLAAGAIVPEAVEAATAAASDFVARGGATTALCDPSPSALDRTNVESVRARGGLIVATGGCFDLLHAGHVAMLQAARRLGDCLVVLLNSDESIRRLKGPDRPIQSLADRRDVITALGCVDEVIVFDETTPIRVLERLRPDIWVKGADYAAADLPEADVVASWGGHAVIVPYLDGRSTTRLLQKVSGRATT